MTAEQRAYVRRETLIGIVINAALSALFVFLVFGSRELIERQEIILDALPQSFMVALMTTIVPTALTRRRLRAGTVAALPGRRSSLPRNLLLRGLAVAVAAALIGGALHWLLLPLLTPPRWTLATLLPYKIAYGGLLAMLLGPFTLRQALADGIADA